MLRYILCPCCHGRDLVKSSWDIFWVPAGMLCVWSAQVKIHIVSSMAWEGFGQHMLKCICLLVGLGGFGHLMLKCILCPMFWSTCVEIHFFVRWHVRSFDNTCWDYNFVSPRCHGMGLVIHFVSSLAWVGLVNICWDTFCFLAGME